MKPVTASYPRYTTALLLFALLFVASACEDDLLEPDLRGNLDGQVLDFDTGAPLSGVSIFTAPPTDALVTDVNGLYRIEDLPAGNYTVSGRLNGYDPNSITVSVRDGETTPAVFFLEVETDTTAGRVADFEASVLNFTTRNENDSTFVTVEYRARNTGTTDIAAYEVYFQVLTSGPTFFEEVSGENLGVGQSDIGEFEQYVGEFDITAVEVSDVYYDGQDANHPTSD